MKLRVTLAVCAALTACESEATSDPAASPLPTAVSCTDASQLRQRAADERGRIDGLKSDQKRITAGSRASFLASLAIVADLKCKVALAAADEAVQPALEAARQAEAASSWYEQVRRWNEADFLATRVIALLIERLADKLSFNSSSTSTL